VFNAEVPLGKLKGTEWAYLALEWFCIPSSDWDRKSHTSAHKNLACKRKKNSHHWKIDPNKVVLSIAQSNRVSGSAIEFLSVK
jgi:hypothetical protein